MQLVDVQPPSPVHIPFGLYTLQLKSESQTALGQVQFVEAVAEKYPSYFRFPPPASEMVSTFPLVLVSVNGKLLKGGGVPVSVTPLE